MILVDSGFLLALAQPTDALHARAVDWAQHLSEPLLVTEYVLLETVNSLSKRADRPRAHRMVDMISGDANYTLVPASPDVLAGGRVHLPASKPTTVQAMAMSAATSDSPAIRPEATGTE